MPSNHERKANQRWTVAPNTSGIFSHEAAQLAVLQDIRDEMQQLNRLLACPNFIGIPKTLRDIKRAVNRIPTVARPRKPKVKK